MAATLAACYLLVLPFASNSLLLRTLPRECASGRRGRGPESASAALYDGGGGGGRSSFGKKKISAGESARVNGVDFSGRDIVDPKDEALMQAQSAVSSLESALNSAVGSLENMQRQLQMRAMQLEKELEETRAELGRARAELEYAKAELRSTRDELVQSRRARDELESALSYREIQISGKVSNHPTIPDGDAIVTSPLVDAGKAVERKIVTTSSGSKYRLATPMTMPSSDSASVKTKEATSSRRRGARSEDVPDLDGFDDDVGPMRAYSPRGDDAGVDGPVRDTAADGGIDRMLEDFEYEMGGMMDDDFDLDDRLLDGGTEGEEEYPFEGKEDDSDGEYGQGSEKGALYDAYNLLHSLAQVRDLIFLE